MNQSVGSILRASRSDEVSAVASVHMSARRSDWLTSHNEQKAVCGWGRQSIQITCPTSVSLSQSLSLLLTMEECGLSCVAGGGIDLREGVNRFVLSASGLCDHTVWLHDKVLVSQWITADLNKSTLVTLAACDIVGTMYICLYTGERWLHLFIVSSLMERSC